MHSGMRAHRGPAAEGAWGGERPPQAPRGGSHPRQRNAQQDDGTSAVTSTPRRMAITHLKAPHSVRIHRACELVHVAHSR